MERRCSDARRGWQGDKAAIASKLSSDESGAVCGVYRRSLQALAGACAAFAHAAAQEVVSATGGASAAVAANSSVAAQLTARLLTVWRADMARVSSQHAK